MYLKNANGETLEFNIVDYEFPELDNVEWDSNWLVVSIAVKLERGEWTASDPSLLTTDLDALIGWFTRIFEGHEVKSRIDFMEPDLEFELLSEGEKRTLRIYFEAELNPDVLNSIIDDLQEFKSKFPARA